MKIFLFVMNSVLLGFGLAMDAFSVSVANGLNERNMRNKKRLSIAGSFAFFQWAMPMAGWMCVRLIAEQFKAFEKLIPWIALILLMFIGGKMFIEGLFGEQQEAVRLTPYGLLVQSIATSIDALSVGFTIASYTFTKALICTLIIGAVTFVICIIGLRLGRALGMKLAGKSGIVGGTILIGIGVEIFVTGIVK